MLNKEEIQQILRDEMDFPSMRIEQFNINYILRNLGIKNGNHPKYMEIINSLKSPDRSSLNTEVSFFTNICLVRRGFLG